MPTAYSYLRVSSQGQAESGLSLDHQDDSVRKFFDAHLAGQGYTLGEVFRDAAVSAKQKLPERPEGARLCQVLRRGDVVVFAKLDRGFRSATDLLNTVDRWQKDNVRVIFLDYQIDTLSPMGRCMLTIGAAFAELERNFISERMKMAHAQARKEGRAMASPKFGMKRLQHPRGKGRIEVPDPRIHKHIALMHELRFKRRMTVEGIYFHFIKDGIINPRTGKEYSYQLIRKGLATKPILEHNLEKTEAIV